MRLIDANHAQHIANISLIAKNAPVVTWVLAQTPTIEAEPVKHGRWISHEGYEECNLCHAKTVYGHNYCPNCGAKMDEGE